MTRVALSLAQKASRSFSRTIPRTTPRTSLLRPSIFRAVYVPSRSISSTKPLFKGLSPETDNPQPKVAESNDTASAKAAADITTDRFHELSDIYLNALVEKLEELQEGREDVEVEYSAGVLSLTYPPNGTYVLNKQPPNKQIWLSSPISGPKRFDFVIASEGQDAKEGTGAGEWIYLRDGTTLSEVLLKEVGVDMIAAVEESSQ